MTRALIVALLALLVLPASAGALTPTAPVDGATGLSEHPVFTWSIAGDSANVIVMSRAARTTPEGEFYDEDRETSDAIQGAATTWSPTTAIAAGTYWWNLQWFADDYSSSGWTAPLSFTIPARLRAPIVRVPTRFSFAVYADTSWWSNTRAARVTAELVVGKRRASRRVVAEPSLSIAVRNSSSVRLPVPAWARGKRGVVRVTVASGGRSVRAARALTLPRD